MSIPVEESTLKNILEKLRDIEVTYKKTNDEYLIGDKQVPRVTEVLSAMLNDDWIANWANGLGWKRISYRAFMNEAADKGTYSHLAVEKFLKEGYVDIDTMEISNDSIRNTVYSAFAGFLKWWEDIHNKYASIDVAYIEKKLIHRYFGGTCDCLLRVNDEYWLIDFKTSAHMSYKYALQLSAYRFLLKELENININKAMILRLDKKDYNYQTYEINLDDTLQKEFMDDCLKEFMMLVLAYQGRLYTEAEYKRYF